MSDEIKLTLDGATDAEIESELALTPKEAEAQVKLTPAEQKQVDDFAKTIDLTDSSVILGV